jgi:three-Cys-motif partner protein
MTREMQFDEIGYWSEVKLEIVREYAVAYSTILTKKKLTHVYVDAFAGGGQHISRSSGSLVPGSPSNALEIQPPFREYHFIDLDAAKIDNLQRIAGTRRDVHIYEGDCNRIMMENIFPTLRYESFRRALCLLDPYGLDLNWELMFTAGQLGTVDIFLNFPVMGMNRTVLWRNPEAVPPTGLARMRAFWGDDSWKSIAYTPERSLFGELEKESNEVFAAGFRQRLMRVAGFKRVPEPVPMRNSKGAVVYFLFFASQVDVAEKIVNAIFDKYRRRGVA